MAVKLGNGNWAVKENKLLAYNDNSGRFFNKEFDFSRGSSATYVGKDGLIKSAASDVPRIDFSDSTNGALLLEPQTTQIVTYSEDFSNASWSKSLVTIESGYLAPDGTLNAFKVSSGGGSLTTNPPTLQTTTRTIYARTVSGTGTAQLLSHNSNTNNIFTLTEQWQRFDLNASGGTGFSTFYAVDFRGSGTLSEVILWGVNATNDQSYATSYIPSLSGSTTTRLADVCNNSGSAQDFNSEEGVLYIEAKVKSDSNSSINSIGISNGTDSNRLSIIMYGNSDLIRANMNVSSVSQFDFLQYGNNPEQYYKIAVSYKQNDCKIFINGVKVGVDISATMPSLGTFDRLNLDIGNNLYDFYGNVKDLQLFTEAKSDEFLAALTTI